MSSACLRMKSFVGIVLCCLGLVWGQQQQEQVGESGVEQNIYKKYIHREVGRNSSKGILRKKINIYYYV